jgi:hypothetical protein
MAALGEVSGFWPIPNVSSMIVLFSGTTPPFFSRVLNQSVDKWIKTGVAIRRWNGTVWEYIT